MKGDAQRKGMREQEEAPPMDSPQIRELEMFANDFKIRRIKLGEYNLQQPATYSSKFCFVLFCSVFILSGCFFFFLLLFGNHLASPLLTAFCEALLFLFYFDPRLHSD